MLFSSGSIARAEQAKPYPECARKPSDADLQAAEAAHKAASVSFNEADYPRAILYWEDAFRRDCTATLLLVNLSRAYELSGQKAEAVMALETLLAREPNLSDKAQITRRIEVLKEQIAAETPPPAAPEPTPEPTTPAPLPAEEPAPTGKTPSRPIFPLVVAGVGGAIFIGGGLVFLGAAADVNKYRDHCDDPNNPDGPSGCPADEIEPANQAVKRRDAAGVVTLIGIPIMAGGLIWYFATPPSASATRVTPAVGKGFVGLALDGRF